MADNHTCPVCRKSFQWGLDDDSKIVEREGERWLSCRENAHWKLTFHVKQEHPDHGFYCPRRVEGAVFGAEIKDYWGVRDGRRACSYCGSMHPDDLFEAIDLGCQVTGTDKNYKIYVEVRNPDAGKRVKIGESSGPAFDRDGNPMLEDLTTEEKLKGSYSRPLYGPASATKTLKFYYQHLDDAGQERFIELYNAKKINLGRFGLYRLPYFASAK